MVHVQSGAKDDMHTGMPHRGYLFSDPQLTLHPPTRSQQGHHQARPVGRPQPRHRLLMEVRVVGQVAAP